MFFYKKQFHHQSSPDSIVRDISTTGLKFKNNKLKRGLRFFMDYWWGYLPLSTVFHMLKQDLYPIGSIVLFNSSMQQLLSVLIKTETNYICHVEMYDSIIRNDIEIKSYTEQNYIVSGSSITLKKLINALINRVLEGCLLKQPSVIFTPRIIDNNLTLLKNTLNLYLEKLDRYWWGTYSEYELESKLRLKEVGSAVIFTPAVYDAVLAVAVKTVEEDVIIYFIQTKCGRYICTSIEYYWSVDSPQKIIDSILQKENASLIPTELETINTFVEQRLTEFEKIVFSCFWGIIEGNSAEQNEEDAEIMFRLTQHEAITIYHHLSDRLNYLITIFLKDIKYEVCYSNIGYEVFKSYSGTYERRFKINTLSDLLQNITLVPKPLSSLQTMCREIIDKNQPQNVPKITNIINKIHIC